MLRDGARIGDVLTDSEKLGYAKRESAALGHECAHWGIGDAFHRRQYQGGSAAADLNHWALDSILRNFSPRLAQVQFISRPYRSCPAQESRGDTRRLQKTSRW